MTQPRPDIDPKAPPEIVPQPEPAPPQPVDPVPPGPEELPDTPLPVEDPTPGQPAPEPGPGGDQPPTRSSIMSEKHPQPRPGARRPEAVPPMPLGLPTSSADHPRTTPLRHGEKEPLDYTLPPEPKNDWNP